MMQDPLINNQERSNHCFLGGGIYAEITPDYLILRMDALDDSENKNTIYLEEEILNNLLHFLGVENDNFTCKKKNSTDETKYAIAQVVWRLNDENLPQKFRIQDIDYDSDAMYLDEDGNWWLEEQLYLTRNILVENQISHWEGLRICP